MVYPSIILNQLLLYVKFYDGTTLLTLHNMKKNMKEKRNSLVQSLFLKLNIVSVFIYLLLFIIIILIIIFILGITLKKFDNFYCLK